MYIGRVDSTAHPSRGFKNNEAVLPISLKSDSCEQQELTPSLAELSIYEYL